MDKDAHYMAVGAFVLIAVAAAVVFVNWYAQRGDAIEIERYTIYFTGSVSGLTEGGPVRYLGVNVGRVQEISLDTRGPRQVRVIVSIDATTPIASNTEASLRLQGITGLLFVELSEGAGPATPLKVPPGEPYPVIATSPSQFDQLIAGLPEMVERATDLLTRGSELLSDENIEAVTISLTQLREASVGLPETVADVRRLIGRLEIAMNDMAGAARRIGEMTEQLEPDVLDALEQLKIGAESLGKMSIRLEGLVARNEGRIDQFTDTGLVDLQRMIQQVNATAAELEALASSLRRDPSQIVSRPSYRGVEIER